MRSENRAEKTLLRLLLIDKPAAVHLSLQLMQSAGGASGRLYSRGPPDWRRRFLGCGGGGYRLLIVYKPTMPLPFLRQSPTSLLSHGWLAWTATPSCLFPFHFLCQSTEWGELARPGVSRQLVDEIF